MIPKLIHCVWLSGEEKPKIYSDCILSWKKVMPDYEICEWTLANLPKQVLTHTFVASAIKAKKWAYATDFIRLWALYTYGGVYMDMDVMVYKSFNVFLSHGAFSCIEFNPRNFYKNLRKKSDKIYGLNIEAAVIGAKSHHVWIQDMIEYYNHLDFNANMRYCKKILMPLIISKISLKYGFRYIPVYQVLDNDIHIYPPDTFSSCYDTSILKCSSVQEYGNYPIRYSYHLCTHSWYEGIRQKSISYYIKTIFFKIIGKEMVSKIKSFFSHGLPI